MIQRLSSSLTGVSVLLLLSTSIYGQSVKGFVERTYKDSDGEHRFTVFVPHGYNKSNKYPVILFLHGAGETKGGSKKPMEVGIGPAIKKRESTFPFIVVIPQAETRGWGATSDNARRALAMLDSTLKEFSTDPKRVYLTGLSMGGFGTWSLAEKYPERWAAIVPICGGIGGRPNQPNDGRAKEVAAIIKDIPCWCFHGSQDPTVSVNLSRTLVQAVKDAGGKPKYTEYPGVGHNSWDKAYGTEELYQWLLSQHKP